MWSEWLDIDHGVAVCVCEFFESPEAPESTMNEVVEKEMSYFVTSRELLGKIVNQKTSLHAALKRAAIKVNCRRVGLAVCHSLFLPSPRTAVRPTRVTVDLKWLIGGTDCTK